MPRLRSRLIRLAHSMPTGTAPRRSLVALLRQARDDGPRYQDYIGHASFSDDPTDIKWRKGLWIRVLTYSHTGDLDGRENYKKWGNRKTIALMDGLKAQIGKARTYQEAKKAVDAAATTAYRYAAQGAAGNLPSLDHMVNKHLNKHNLSSPAEMMGHTAEGLDKVVREFPQMVKAWDRRIEDNHKRKERWEADQRKREEDPAAWGAQKDREDVLNREIYDAMRSR